MFAETETKIIERLQARLSADVSVMPVREIEKVPELRQKAPAVFVIYDGYNPAADIPNVPHVQQVRQDWFVVIAARSAKGSGDVSSARDAADALCDQVLTALLGYNVGGGKYLRLEPAPGPEYDGGYCHIPLAFSCAATFKGA